MILICDGEYFEHLDVPSSLDALTLESRNGPEVTILDGGGTGRVVDTGADSLTLRGLTIRNGYADELFGNGGGVRSFSSELTIDDCHVHDNAHGDEGGALGVQGDLVTMVPILAWWRAA